MTVLDELPLTYDRVANEAEMGDELAELAAATKTAAEQMLAAQRRHRELAMAAGDLVAVAHGRGYNLAKLARRAGVNRATLYKWMAKGQPK